MELTWLKVISGGFALVGAVAVAVWQVRADRIEDLKDQIASYEQAANLNLPKSLEALDKANAALTNRLSVVSELESLKPKLEESLKNVSVLEKEIADLKRELSEKEKYIKELYIHSGSIRIWEGNTKHLGGHQVVIGVVDVNNSEHSVVTLVNNEKLKLIVGGHHQFSLNNNICKLVLDNTYFDYGATNSYVDFSYSCTKAKSNNAN